MRQVTFIPVLLAAGLAPQPEHAGSVRSQRREFRTIAVGRREHFVYYQTMNVSQRLDTDVSRIAAAIGEPARTRMLHCLMDGKARTSTELALVAEVSPSTASVHLNQLRTARLVKLDVQGKHRYYSLEGPDVARALEALSILSGGSHDKFVPNTPNGLVAA